MAAPLTDSEMRQITRLQREEGIRRLSSHLSWPEFSGDAPRERAHQQFVYDSTMFAAARGLPWPDVIAVARMTKGIFPELKGLDVSRVLCLIRDRLSECLPRLTPAHHTALFHYLSDTCVARRRLLQAVVSGASHLSISQAHLEVQVPPAPPPLAQGVDVCLWERQQAQLQITIAEQQKREELQHLREGSGVILEELDTPKEERMDRQAVLELVQGAVKARGGLLLDRLLRESSLVHHLLELKLQHTALTTGGLHHTPASHTPP